MLVRYREIKGLKLFLMGRSSGEQHQISSKTDEIYTIMNHNIHKREHV